MAVSKYDTEVDLDQGSNSSHWQVADLIGSAKRVLDVGCSTGYFAEALGARGNEVVGLEYDDASAAEARARGLEVLTGDLEAVDLAEHFGEAAFDVVVYADVLEHLRDPLPVLRATHRLLRPGGFVVISLPNIAHGDVRLSLLEGRFDYTSTGILDDTHTKFFTRRSLTAFVRHAGFAVAELRRTRKDLFGTELALDPADYDAELVDRVLRDPESTTYQFVLKAVRDDAGASGLEHAERLYEAETERDRLAAENARLRAEVTGLESEVEHLRPAADLAERARAQADEARARAERAIAESDRLQGEMREVMEEQQRRGEAEIERLRGERRRIRVERDELRARIGEQDA